MKRMKSEDIYEEPITYIRPNAVVTVYRPILTPEERERRMNQIAKAAAKLIIATEKKKEERRRNQHE